MSALVDYAWQKPSPAQIVAAGYTGVLRYLSFDASKNLSPAERDGLLAAGLAIGLVWETTATRAGQGYGAGQQDVQAAEAQANALGYPAGCPIFYAVDYDAAVSAVLPYFQGVVGLAHHPVGVYGSANIIEGVPVPWKWQTLAWSYKRVSSQAHIYQNGGPTLPGCGYDAVLKPIPLWTATSGLGGLASGVVTIPGAPTFPTAPTAPPIQEDDMAFKWYYVKATPDGPTQQIMASWDGIIGPCTDVERPILERVAGAGSVDNAGNDAILATERDQALAWRTRVSGVAAILAADADAKAIAAQLAASLPKATAQEVVTELSQKLGA